MLPRYALMLVFMSVPASAQEIQSATPASVQVFARCHGPEDKKCIQSAASLAQSHCRKHGRDARFARAVDTQYILAPDKVVFFYDCVR